MPKIKKDFLQQAKEKGGDELTLCVNGEPNSKMLDPRTLARYQQKLD